MNSTSVKTFFSKLFRVKKHVYVFNDPITLGINDLCNTLDEMGKSVDSISQSISGIYKCKGELLDIYQARIIEIRNFTTTPEFAYMVLNRPHEVKKLRDELDSLIVKANNV